MSWTVVVEKSELVGCCWGFLGIRGGQVGWVRGRGMYMGLRGSVYVETWARGRMRRGMKLMLGSRWWVSGLGIEVDLGSMMLLDSKKVGWSGGWLGGWTGL